MNTLKSVLGRFENSKISLSDEKKVMLSAKDDLEKAMAFYTPDTINFQEVSSVNEKGSDFRNSLENLKSATLPFIEAYEYVQQNYSNLSADVDKLQEAIENYERLADELGIDPSGVPLVQDAKEGLADLEELSLEADKALSGFERLYYDANEIPL